MGPGLRGRRGSARDPAVPAGGPAARQRGRAGPGPRPAHVRRAGGGGRRGPGRPEAPAAPLPLLPARAGPGRPGTCCAPGARAESPGGGRGPAVSGRRAGGRRGGGAALASAPSAARPSGRRDAASRRRPQRPGCAGPGQEGARRGRGALGKDPCAFPRVWVRVAPNPPPWGASSWPAARVRRNCCCASLGVNSSCGCWVFLWLVYLSRRVGNGFVRGSPAAAARAFRGLAARAPRPSCRRVTRRGRGRAPPRPSRWGLQTCARCLLPYPRGSPAARCTVAFEPVFPPTALLSEPHFGDVWILLLKYLCPAVSRLHPQQRLGRQSAA